MPSIAANSPLGGFFLKSFNICSGDSICLQELIDVDIECKQLLSSVDGAEINWTYYTDLVLRAADRL